MKAPRIYYGILAAFCIVSIFVGMASAADSTHSPRNITHLKGQMHPAFDLTNTTMQQAMIARYTQQGTDTAGLTAAFQSGNMTDVKTWLEANRPAEMGVRNWSAHQKSGLTNTTMRQAMIARYTQQGTDTTGLTAAFQSGNMTDVKTWLEAHRPAEMGVRNWSAHQKSGLTNTTMQQEMIARYTQQGTDTTGLAAAFQSGNMTDVKTWLEAHRPVRHTPQS